ncbi:hypothetical protein [Halobacillus litoralis]|uniref:hypothetical protein n=1 Tax=Halobacillus litoralis TaxID=45668 RepID=UPI001CD6BF4C|nr:hypothetical protein [Halobacillus litoralis]MCA1021524.1 hypothetical protein [Halobacillus litoralis]
MESKLYMLPIHPNASKREDGELPEVTGVYMFQPKPSMKKRPCYKVEYKDGSFDYVPLSGIEKGSYELVEITHT